MLLLTEIKKLSLKSPNGPNSEIMGKESALARLAVDRLELERKFREEFTSSKGSKGISFDSGKNSMSPLQGHADMLNVSVSNESKNCNSNPFKLIGRRRVSSPNSDSLAAERMPSVGGPNPLWIVMNHVFPSKS